MKAIYLSILFLFFLLLFRKEEHTILFLPLINLFFDMGFAFYDYRSIPTFLRLIFIIIFLSYCLKYLKFNLNISRYILFFILLLSTKTLLSSEIISYKILFQLSVSLIMFVIAYNYFNSLDKIENYIKNTKYVIYIAPIASFIGYFFKIGRHFEYRLPGVFEKDEFTIGLLNSAGFFSVAIILILIPFVSNLIKNRKERIIFYISSVASYIFIVLTMRRTVILIPIIGVVFYILYGNFKLKKKILSFILFSALFLILISPLYINSLLIRFEVRQKAGVFESNRFESEGRTIENINLLKYYINNAHPAETLFGIGNNIFASSYMNGKVIRRGMHSDTGKLLYGVGLVGTFLYLILYILFFKKIKYIRIKELKYLYILHLIILIIITYYGSFTLFSLRIIIFINLGMIIRYNKILSYKII